MNLNPRIILEFNVSWAISEKSLQFQDWSGIFVILSLKKNSLMKKRKKLEIFPAYAQELCVGNNEFYNHFRWSFKSKCEYWKLH